MVSEKMSTSGSRRGSKPLVEKKRRARINHSLMELQSLISINKKEGKKQTRVEKADILEMTVRHLKSIQNDQRENVSSSSPSSFVPTPSSPSSHFGQFCAGYLECLSELSRYLTTIEKLDTGVYERLRRHLLVRLHQLQDGTKRMTLVDVKVEDPDARNSPKVTTTTPTTPSPSPSPSSSSGSSSSSAFSSQVSVDCSTNSVPVISNLELAVSCTEALAGVAVIPSRLPTGQLAFVVPTKEYFQYINKYGSPTIHQLTPTTLGHETSSSYSNTIMSTIVPSTSSSSSSTSSSSSLSPTMSMPISSRRKCPEVPNPQSVQLNEPFLGVDNIVSMDGSNVWRPW